MIYLVLDRLMRATEIAKRKVRATEIAKRKILNLGNISSLIVRIRRVKGFEWLSSVLRLKYFLSQFFQHAQFLNSIFAGLF